MSSNYCNIPIFLPELACPHRCVFCNQSHISGTYSLLSPQDSIVIIENHLQTIAENTIVFVAFFGGSFTGLPITIQESYLQIVQPYINSGKIHGIRLSTRPDYISSDIVQLLKKYNVREIELGMQSSDDTVLRMSGRGCDSDSIRSSSRLILDEGIRLGLQMMIGLPGDSYEKSMQTAREIIKLGAHSTRIYPTLVIADTPLAELYKRGEYIPLKNDDAVSWVKDIYMLFIQNNVTVLRVGLHPGEELTNNNYVLDGPFHPQFKELVETAIWKDLFEKELQFNESKNNILIETHPLDVNFAIGHKSSNKNWLLSKFKTVIFTQNKAISRYEFTYSYN